MGSAWYLYGIAEAGIAVGIGGRGVGDPPAPVLVLEEAGLAAIVSPVDPACPLSVLRDSRTHERVLEEVLERGAVLPVGFGTVADSEGAVRRLLAGRREELARALSRLADKVEVGVKAFWEKEAVLAELRVRWGDDPRRAWADTAGKGALELGVQVGKAVAEVIERWKRTHVREATKRLEAEAVAARYNEPITVRMLLNAAYLVYREHLPVFERVVREVDRELGQRMRFHLVAPLPPYNFVDLKLSPDEVKERV